MILFSGKFANRLMAPEDLKHTYGFVVGTQNLDSIDIKQFFPFGEGFLNEREISETGFTGDLSELEDKSFVCGYFHASPKSGGTLSKTDVSSLSKFNAGSIIIIFDFTKVSQYNNGFLVYQTDGDHIKNTPYSIFHPEEEDKFYFARSLVDLTEQYQTSGGLINTSTNILDNFENPPISMESDEDLVANFESKFQESAPTDYADFELSLLDQDFEIQKLRSDIEQASKVGISSAKLKLQLANRLLSMNANESEILRYLESAEEEYTAASTTEGKIGLATVKNELGLFYEENGNFYTALNYFDESIEILESLSDSARTTRVLTNIGNIYLKLNKFDSALRKYQEAYEKSSLADKVLIFNNIADVYLKLQNYARAYAILMKNAEFFQEQENYYGLAIVFSKFGILYYAQGSAYNHLAKKYTNLALSIKKRNEYFRECIEDYQLLSAIYIDEGAFRVAEDNLIQGLNLVRTLGLDRKEAFFYENLGKLYSIEGKKTECIEYFELAQEMYQKFGEKEQEGSILEHIGDVYSNDLNENSKALAYYDKAIELFKEENYRKNQADLHVKIADIHLDLNEINSAQENLQQAHQLYKIMYDDTTANIISERMKSLEY